VLDVSDLSVSSADLVVTGEGALDWQSMRGKVVSGVARRSLQAGIPVIAIAGRVDITARERSEMGLDAAYSVSELVGEAEALGSPAASLSAAAARVARTWG
jgi:glycerate kinase